jgi:predicted NodU family carbamoyl transferase
MQELGFQVGLQERFQVTKAISRAQLLRHHAHQPDEREAQEARGVQQQRQRGLHGVEGGGTREEAELDEGGEGANAALDYEFLDDSALYESTVAAMLAGKIVGWFQGKMEFGARALGNRSLIADPRRTDMRDIINLRIKFREKFRPFAPSILEEQVDEWFEIDEPTPYMEKVFPIRAEKRALIPSVTHVDGSGRLQTVSKTTNPRYHALITCFYEKTGVPIILNTSLNENEPVVRLPKEAIACFLRTDMDVLVVENCLMRKAAQRPMAGAEEYKKQFKPD